MALSYTESGNNTASTSWGVSYPTAATGDLLIFNIGWDDSTTTTGLTAPAGPNGETAVVVEDVRVSSNTAVRGKIVYYVATGTWTASTLAFTPSASEQWSAVVVKVPAGEFSTSAPIGADNYFESTTTDSTPDLPSLTAGSTDGGGTVVGFMVGDVDDADGSISGWTNRASTDRGAVGVDLWTRNTTATNSESISAATGATYPSARDYVSFIYIIRPQHAPTVALNSPADASSDSDTTPTLDFTGTDADSDSVRYNVQIDTVDTFDSDSSTDTIAYDAASASAWTDASPLTWNHTVGTGSNRFLVVGITCEGGASTSPSAVTFDSVSMTKVREDTYSTTISSSIWVLPNPNSGTKAISVTFNDVSQNCFGGAVSYTGVTQSVTVDSNTGVDDQTATGAVAFNVTTVADNCWTFAVCSSTAASSLVVNTPTKTSRWTTNHTSTSATNGQDSNAAITPGSTAVSMGWTLAGTTVHYCMSGISFAPASTAVPLINVVSGTDSGFANPDTGGDTDPFNSGENIQYTVQSALSADTYYWRVRGIDPSGSNTYGAWATTRSFTVTAGGGTAVKDLIGGGIIPFAR